METPEHAPYNILICPFCASRIQGTARMAVHVGSTHKEEIDDVLARAQELHEEGNHPQEHWLVEMHRTYEIDKHNNAYVLMPEEYYGPIPFVGTPNPDAPPLYGDNIYVTILAGLN